MSRVLSALALLCLSIQPTLLTAAERKQSEILVFAAASLTDALQEIGAAYEESTALQVKMSFDSSSSLAREIEAGARADLFFSADIEWMDYLQSRHLIQIATRRDVIGNQLVLIAPAKSQIKLKIAPHFALVAALGQGRLATADPESVPAGRYARSALVTLGVWNDVSARLARAENVRAALKFVARGEAPLGIVYSSDAFVGKNVRVVDTFPADTHEAIVYPVALTTSARAEAGGFLAFLGSPRARKVFVKYGFTELETKPN